MVVGSVLSDLVPSLAQGAMMASDLVWASIDGPHGVRAVTLPAERWGALALKDQN